MQPHSMKTNNSYLYGALPFNLLILDCYSTAVTACGRQQKILHAIYCSSMYYLPLKQITAISFILTK